MGSHEGAPFLCVGLQHIPEVLQDIVLRLSRCTRDFEGMNLQICIGQISYIGELLKVPNSDAPVFAIVRLWRTFSQPGRASLKAGTVRSAMT